MEAAVPAVPKRASVSRFVIENKKLKQSGIIDRGVCWPAGKSLQLLLQSDNPVIAVYAMAVAQSRHERLSTHEVGKTIGGTVKHNLRSSV